MFSIILEWMNSWVFVIAAIAALYVYMNRQGNYFKKLGIPYLKSYMLVGNRGPVIFRQRSSIEHEQALYNSMPDAKYFGMYDYSSPAIMVRDIELIREIGVKHFDNFVDHKSMFDPELDALLSSTVFFLREDKWRRMRSLLSPAFTSSKIKTMFGLISKCATNLADFVVKQQEPIILDMKDLFSRCTNDVIASTAFGINLNSMVDRQNEFYKMGREVTDFGFLRSSKIFCMQMWPNLARKLKASLLTDRMIDFFHQIIATTVATRRAQGIQRPDLIHLLMQASESETSSKLTVDDMTAQAYIFFFAGFDTSSTTMSFAAYSLAANPDVQEKLQTEIDEALEKCNGEVTYDYLKEMKYLDAVISETLRMYPPVTELDRLCTKPFELPPAKEGGKPVFVKRGTCFLIPVNGIHRDPKFFPNPDKFDPERFLNEKEKINSSAYIPFGVGPRTCIGARFAMIELKLVLFHLLKKCNLKPCAKTCIPMKFCTKSFMPAPATGHWLQIERRK